MAVKFFSVVRVLLGEYSLDVVFLLGTAIAAYGFWLAWRPLGFIIGGLFLAAFAYFTGYRPRGER
jgi:hypothetical protein